MTGIYDLGVFGSYLGIQGFFFFLSASSVFFWTWCWFFFSSSFLGREWTTGACAQLVFLYSEFYSILGVMGGPCYVLGGSGVLSQGAGSLCVLCVWCFFSMVI